MKNLILSLAFLVCLATLAGASQDAGAAHKKPSGAIGDLLAVDSSKKLLTIKTTAGVEVRAAISDTTEYLLTEPGAKSLDNATKIDMDDLKSGDRIWARGDVDASGTIAARQIIVMSAEAIARRNERDARDWQRRGVLGDVRAIDPATREVTIGTYRGDTVVVAIGDKTTLRRLKPGSTDLADSDVIAFDDIKVGGQVAARGDRDAETNKVRAESVLAGSFPRPVRGRVVSIDAAAGTIAIAPMREGGEPTTVRISSATMLRKFTPPPPQAAEPGQPQGAPQAAPGAGPGSGRPGAGPGGQGGPGRRPGGLMFGANDRTELERRTEPLELSDLAAGDFVFAVIEPGAALDQTPATVLVKVVLPPGMMQRGPRQQNSPSLNIPVPTDVPF